MKKCQKCSNPVQDDAAFCPYCGNNMNATQNTPPPPPGNRYYGNAPGNGSYGYQQYENRRTEEYYEGARPCSQAWYNNDAFASGPDGKSRGVTALLCLFFGTLGVHYFYLGKIGGGLLTILLCCVTCGLWSVILLVQAILLFCMNNSDFERKFVKTNNIMPLF